MAQNWHKIMPSCGQQKWCYRIALNIRPDRHLYGHLNPRSGSLRRKCWPELIAAEPEDVFQFERVGYFCVDAKKSRPDALVFNRTVTLRDTWAKLEQEQSGQN